MLSGKRDYGKGEVMFRWLSSYFKTSKERSKKDYYINGFNYAAGALLRKDKTAVQLTNYFYDYVSELDSFDRGIIDAINKLKEIGFIEESYMD